VTATTAIAVYGALVATGGVGWQVFQWRRARRRDVRVTIRHVWHENPPQNGIPADPRWTYEVVVFAVNFGERNVVVDGIGLESLDHGWLTGDDVARRTRELATGQAVEDPMYVRGLLTGKMTHGFRGYVRLTTGENFKSAVTFLEEPPGTP
jgi:hypothetical protein